ncbi:MAG: NrfD/PsrC family molybdoenzyme membrane anchor subunit [Bacteroidota bacterium]
MKRQFPKITFWSGIFYIIIAAGVYTTFVRFTQGLGATTYLSDEFPWGLWIGFDVLCGVGLAAGGFVVASSVYIFNLEHYRPILRPAILTAFLGYILVIASLMFDLGKPWNIWHPLVMWNPHSVMFEVGWCVMLYSIVLALEFSPIIWERLQWGKLQKILHAITIPLVIAGVVLSSLHQSSLGSLYLIIPTKLHPLWYSSNLPYLFFISAIAVGPAMVTIESYYSSRTFQREIELPILSQLGKITVVALSVYLVLKAEDFVNLKLYTQFSSLTFENGMYAFEILGGVLVPLVLLAMPSVRNSKNGVFISSLFVVFGFILNRLNISITGIQQYSNVNYFPHWMEITVTMMMVAIGFAVFHFAAKYLPIFHNEKSEKKPERVTNDIVSYIEFPITTN